MAGSITDEDRAFVESWEHVSPQEWGILRLGPRGDERPEIVRGRRTFKITTEERILTQDKVRNAKDDPFLNGSFRPVVVPDSVTVETNPNALSDEEINKILASSDFVFGEWMDTIDSVATLRRMMEIAESSDDVTVKRFRSLERRLEDVRGTVRIDTNDPALKNFLSNRPSLGAGNTVDNGASNPRRRGGMSGDYR